MRRTAGDGIVITTIQQYHEITALRRESGYDGKRLRAVYRECLDAALHRLDLAFAAFHRRLASQDIAGYPRYKSPSRWSQIEFCHGNRALVFDEPQRRLRIPGVGWMPLRRGRLVPAFGRAWLICKNERWYACFECERDKACGLTTTKMVGVDRGIRVLMSTSDGDKIPNPRFAKSNAALAMHERAVTAATVWNADGTAANRSDRQRRKAVSRLRRAKEQEKNARRDYLHKQARELVNTYSLIALEKLNVRRMTRSARGTIDAPGRRVRAKAGLNRAMLDASFTLIRSMILAKAEEAGRQIIEVDPKYSSQTCSECWYRNPKNRRRELFKCLECGYRDDADINAAKVILLRAQSALRSEPYPGAEPGVDATHHAGAHDEDTELVNKTTDVGTVPTSGNGGR